MTTSFEYVFPAIRGIQASREYYVSMCPLRLLPRLFLFNEEELIPEFRAQRQLNRARLPDIAQYIIHHPDNYVFSAITASVDAAVSFEPILMEGEAGRIGQLHIPMDAKFIINDGQHRRAAIEMALRDRPEIGDESIAVVFFLDVGLERCQQMFADLNRYAIRPSKSLSILYDHRDNMATLAKRIVSKSSMFRDVVELEKTTLSLRSRRLFTLSAIYHATVELFGQTEIENADEKVNLAINFWEQVGKSLKEWELVRNGTITAGEVRQDFIHSHGVVLQAIGKVGNTLIREYPKDWQKRLLSLRMIDWRRTNSTLWEGRALIGGRVSKAQHNLVLTANAIKSYLNLPLTPEEQRVEDAYNRDCDAK